MQQIADWLKKLGMSEYAQRFAENRIDFSVLPDLTDHDLEKLGVVLGDRRKMLRAIANLEAWKIAPVVDRYSCGIYRAIASRHGRTPPSHSYVLGPCGLDCTFGPDGPGRSARGYFGLSEMRRGNRASLRRLRS